MSRWRGAVLGGAEVRWEEGRSLVDRVVDLSGCAFRGGDWLWWRREVGHLDFVPFFFAWFS